MVQGDRLLENAESYLSHVIDQERQYISGANAKAESLLTETIEVETSALTGWKTACQALIGLCRGLLFAPPPEGPDADMTEAERQREEILRHHRLLYALKRLQPVVETSLRSSLIDDFHRDIVDELCSSHVRGISFADTDYRRQRADPTGKSKLFSMDSEAEDILEEYDSAKRHLISDMKAKLKSQMKGAMMLQFADAAPPPPPQRRPSLFEEGKRPPVFTSDKEHKKKRKKKEAMSQPAESPPVTDVQPMVAELSQEDLAEQAVLKTPARKDSIERALDRGEPKQSAKEPPAAKEAAKEATSKQGAKDTGGAAAVAPVKDTPKEGKADNLKQQSKPPAPKPLTKTKDKSGEHANLIEERLAKLNHVETKKPDGKGTTRSSELRRNAKGPAEFAKLKPSAAAKKDHGDSDTAKRAAANPKQLTKKSLELKGKHEAAMKVALKAVKKPATVESKVVDGKTLPKLAEKRADQPPAINKQLPQAPPTGDSGKRSEHLPPAKDERVGSPAAAAGTRRSSSLKKETPGKPPFGLG